MDASRHLPLRPTAFAVLAALASGPRAGVGVLDAVASTGTPVLGPGTLYRLMSELRQQGWVERVPAPDGAGAGDERRQYHGLTADGKAVLRLEAERLRRTLEQAAGAESTG